MNKLIPSATAASLHFDWRRRPCRSVAVLDHKRLLIDFQNCLGHFGLHDRNVATWLSRFRFAGGSALS